MHLAYTILYIVDSSPEEGGRLNDELRYSAEIKKIKNLNTVSNLTDEEKRLRLEGVCDASSSADEDGSMLFSVSKMRRKQCAGDGGLSGGFTLFIQTPRNAGSNVLTQDDLLTHAQLLEDISRMSVEYAD